MYYKDSIVSPSYLDPFDQSTEINGCFFQHFSKVCGKILVGFCVNTGKGFFLEISF